MDIGMMGCRDEERQGERVVGMWGSDPVRREPGLPTESRHGRSGGAGRWQQRPSAGPGAGAVPGGVPEGRGGRGLRGHPSALPPVLRPHPLRGCGAVLQGSCGGQRSCPWLSVPGGMHMDGVPTRTRVGPAVPSSRAPAPSRSSSMAGNSRLRWRRALPEILVRAGAVNSIFFSPGSHCRAL